MPETSPLRRLPRSAPLIAAIGLTLAVSAFNALINMEGVYGESGAPLAWSALGVILLLTAALLGYLRALHLRTEALQRLADSRKDVEKLAREREQILQSLGEGVFGIDREGRTTFFNRAAGRILGWGEEELLGIPQHELFHHTRADGTRHPLDSCPIHAPLRDGARCHVDDDLFWHRDGYAVPVEFTSTPLLDERGRPWGAVVVFSDISDRLLVEAELQRERDLLERIMDTSPSGVLVADHRGRFVFSNLRALEIFLLPREEITGRDFGAPEWRAEDIDGEPLEEETLPFRRITAQRRSLFDVQFSIVRSDGERRLLSVNGAPVYDNEGKLERVVYTLGDITERRAEELERIRILDENRRLTRQLFKIQEEERRAIARDLHDELGQYLVAMGTEVKLISRLLDEPTMERLVPLRELIDQTQGVVRGIIHRLRPVLLEKLGLGGAIYELVSRWRERHPDIEVELEVAGEFAGLESEVAHAAYRVVQEGLTNIDKYAAAKRVEVRLNVDRGGRLVVEVIDNGRGLQQVRSAGMGQLGMRERVASLNGCFTIESEMGRGVSLRAEIPIEPAG